MNHHSNHSPYRRLAIMTLLSFASMYILMYAMVDVFAHVLPNINQFYMAGLMTGAMVLIEFVVMRSMYPNTMWNIAIILASIVFLTVCWFGIREQTFVSDKQFLQSMIPHHAGALLMCEKATLTDPEVQELCEAIILGQQEEIEWMQTKLNALP